MRSLVLLLLLLLLPAMLSYGQPTDIIYINISPLPFESATRHATASLVWAPSP